MPSTTDDRTLNIKHLIDMAIGTPEIGVVNFNVLHAVLHAIVENLNLQNLYINMSTYTSGRDLKRTAIATGPEVGVNMESDAGDLVREQCNELFPAGISQSAIGKGNNNKGDQENSEFLESPLFRRSVGGDDNLPTNAQKSESSDDFPTRFTSTESSNQAIRARQRAGSDNGADDDKAPPSDPDHISSNAVAVQEMIAALEEKLNAVIKDVVEVQEENKLIKIQNESFETQLMALMGNMKSKPSASLVNQEIEEDAAIEVLYKSETIEAEDLVDIAVDREDILEVKVELEQLQVDFGSLKAMLLCQGVLNGEREDIGHSRELKAKVDDIETDTRKAELQITDMSKEICHITERVEELIVTVQKARRSSATVQLADLHRELTALKDYIDKTNESFERISIEHQEISKNFDEVSRHLDDLHKTKVDKEEIDELLSEKADYSILQRKVSVEYIDANRRSLEKKLCEMDERIEQVEASFNSQLVAMKSDIDGQKLGNTFSEFRMRVEHDLQALRDRLGKHSSARSEVEAAGTKTKYLRNVNCISCDQPAVMRTFEGQAVNRFDEAYATQTNSPLITFELAHIRQIGIKGYHEKDDMEHLLMGTNRRCGGSHTKVSTADRVRKERFDKINRIVGNR